MCPSSLTVESGENLIYNSYGYNCSLTTTADLGTADMANHPQQDFIESPTENLMFSDAVEDRISYLDSWSYTDDANQPVWPDQRAPAYRHDDGFNVAFFDGHAGFVPRSEADRMIDAVAAERLWIFIR